MRVVYREAADMETRNDNIGLDGMIRTDTGSFMMQRVSDCPCELFVLFRKCRLSRV